MSRFAAIRTERPSPGKPDIKPDALPAPSPVTRAPTRAGKKAVSGYFSAELSRSLHILALERDTSLQALMGEAFDDLMRKYGKHPFGER